MPLRLFPLIAIVALAPACARGVPPAATPIPARPATPAPTATATPEPPEEDPVALAVTAEGMTRLCDERLAAAKEALASIEALDGKPPAELRFENTLDRLDDVFLALEDASDLPGLMKDAHPDAAVRVAARRCEPEVERFRTALWLDATLARVVRAYAAKNEPLAGERARFLADVLRDFRRHGLELGADQRQRLASVSAELSRVSETFLANANTMATVDVPRSALDGLPPEYVARHPPNAKGTVAITTDYSDFFPFVTYSSDRAAAKRLYVAFTNRGGDENVRILDRMLALRAQEAKLLGYPSWAAYVIEPRMAKTPDEVRAFLDRVADALRAPARAEYEALVAEHVRLGGKATDRLSPSDRLYLEDRVRHARFGLDSRALSDYLEVSRVTQGLLDVASRMFGLRFEPAPSRPKWHPDVLVYSVYQGDERLGELYLDLYARPDKYKHTAMFSVRAGKRFADGRVRRPAAALLCNFPKPGNEPALLAHDDVVTLFHEFGHVLHHLLTRAELARYSGTAVARDFVEVPSQMLEEWAWSREVLDLFARHHATGERIPDDLFAALERSRAFGRALDMQRQVFLAELDLELHTRPVGIDTTKLVEELETKLEPFGYLEGTHVQSSFSHLVGYDAGYYGYAWALSLSRDLLTRFRAAGLLDPKTAASFRDEILAKGGGADERAMVTAFLGRPPRDDAFFAYLAGKD